MKGLICPQFHFETESSAGAPNDNFRKNICSDFLAESLVIRKL